MKREDIDKFFDSHSKEELQEKWNKYNKYSEGTGVRVVNFTKVSEEEAKRITKLVIETTKSF